MRRIIKPLIKTLLWVAAIVLLAAGAMRAFFVDRVAITHNGMAPTLLAGEEALLWRGADVELGDIAVCEHPSEPGQLVLGRVIATPGKTVKTRRGRLEVEGTVPDRDIQGEVRFYDSVNDVTNDMIYGVEKFGNTDHQFFEREDGQFRLRDTKVEAGLFLLGDNRTYVGQDSRYFGTVDPATCVGTVFMRWKPADDPGAELAHGWLDIVR